jgi:hypothetical protein
MKSYLVVLGLMVNLAHGEESCTDKDNLFIYSYTSSNACDEQANKEKENSLSKINEIISTQTLDDCMIVMRPPRRSAVIRSELEVCQKVESCEAKLNASLATTLPSFNCSIQGIKGLFSKAKTEKTIEEGVGEGSKDLELGALVKIAKKINPAFLESDFCPVKKAQEECTGQTPGISWNLISSVIDNKREKNIKMLVDSEDTAYRLSIEGGPSRFEFGSSSGGALLQLGGGAGSGGGAPQGGGRPSQRASGIQYYLSQSRAKTQGIAELKMQGEEGGPSEPQEYLEYLLSDKLKSLGVDFKTEMEKAKKVGTTVFNNPFVLTDLIKKAHSKENCEKTFYDEVKICERVVAKFKAETKISQKKEIVDYISKKKKEKNAAFNKYNESLIGKTSNMKNFNLEEFLTLSDKVSTCINNFQDKTFVGVVDGKSASERWDLYKKKMSQASEDIKLDIKRNTSITAERIADTLEKSEDATLRSAGKKYREEARREFNTGDLFPDSKIADGKNNFQNLPPQAAPIAQAPVNPSQLPVKTDGTDAFSAKGMSAAVNKMNDSIQAHSQPVAGNFDNGGSTGSTVVANNNALMKKLDELSDREKTISKKVEDKVATAAESEEMKELQRQIEELKKQVAASSGQDALGNKLIAPKVDPAAATAAAIADKSKAQTPSSIAAQSSPAQTSKREAADYDSYNQSSKGRSSFESANDNIADSKPSSVSRATASGGAKGGASSGSFGLVLSRSGELTEDLSKIAENPKDSDILSMIEKSNGKPFIIRENGALIQIVPTFDSAGKIVLENGKPKLKKVKLSKDAEVQIAREFNPIREAKVVRDTVRLHQLKAMTTEAVK